MDSSDAIQPVLFDFNQATSGAVELFPAVWGAMENLTAPDAGIRRSGLERLQELSAARLSPLVAYLVATRLEDADLGLRCSVVRVLGKVLSPDANGYPPPEAVRLRLQSRLAQMRTRSIFALLETIDAEPELEASVALLLNGCPNAGNHLVGIVNERKFPLHVRKQSVLLISLVGFLDAVPALERLQSRLEARLHGQKAMPFAPPGPEDEVELLPAVQQAITALKTI